MAKKRHEPAKLELNLTSMLDIVFQLIIFFILVTNFANAQLPKLELPEPAGSKAKANENVKKVIVNIVPVRDENNKPTGQTKHLVIAGEKRPANDYAYITDYLKKQTALYPDLEVNLRADKGLHFEAIQPVMRAVTQAKIAHINLGAYEDRD